MRRSAGRFSELFEKLRSCEKGIVPYCPDDLFVFPKQQPDILFPANVTLKYNRSDPNFHRAGLPHYVCYDGTWCEQDYNQSEQICRTLNQLRIQVTETLTFWQFYDKLKRFFSLNCHPPSILAQVCSFSSFNSRYIFIESFHKRYDRT